MQLRSRVQKIKQTNFRTPPRKQAQTSKQTKEAMSSSARKKDTSGPIFFWSQKTDYGFMSQWYPISFKCDKTGVEYSCAEQYMMHHKALQFDDTASEAKILATSDPGEQKFLGSKVKPWNEETWKTCREKVVEEGNYLKFRQNEDLQSKLLKTGDRELVEASKSDRIWGIGFRANEAIGRRSDWGLNLLGKCLMRVRERLRAEMKAEKYVEEIGEGDGQREEEEGGGEEKAEE